MHRVAAVCSGLALSAALPMFSQYTPVQISSVPGLGASFVRNDVKATNCTGQAGLACAIPNLYGPYGLVLPNPFHAAHFEKSNFQTSFTALNDAIATQLTLLPLPSPASGFTFHFDPTTGLSVRSAESFGPILTERPETIGRNRFYFGFAYQRFRFDKLDDQPLHNLPVVFNHELDTGPGHTSPPYETQFISTINSIDLKINQYTFFATYGLTSRIDLSVAVPILQIGMNVTSNATIERTLNTEPVQGFAHYFDPADKAGSLTHTFANNQFSPDMYTNFKTIDNLYWDPSRNNAAGFGDVVFRFKGDVYRTERFNLAFLTDVRFPTGDEKQFLGSGAYGVRPFVAMSMRTGHFSPHVNLGYQWNGSSILAGSILTGTKAHLPGSASFAGGVDVGVTRFLTAVADYIGLEVINAPRIQSGAYTSKLPLASTGQIGTFSTINTVKETYNQSSGSFGVKANLFKQFLLTANILVALNNGGLRERVIPLVGASYTF